MPRPRREIGRRIGLVAIFVTVGPAVGAATFPLVVGLDHLVWPDNPAQFALAGMLLAGAVLTMLPSLIAGLAGAILSRRWKRGIGWLAQAAAICALATMLEGILFAVLSGPNAAALFQTSDATMRTIMLIVMFGLVGTVGGLAGAVATQGWRPKNLSAHYAETFD